MIGLYNFLAVQGSNDWFVLRSEQKTSAHVSITKAIYFTSLF